MKKKNVLAAGLTLTVLAALGGLAVMRLRKMQQCAKAAKENENTAGISPDAGGESKAGSPEAPVPQPVVQEEAVTESEEPVPAETEIKKNPAEGTEESGKLNINTASQEALESLPGVGAALAERIVLYRQKQGGFKNTEEIMKVSGIGRARFESMAALITTGEIK
ncbi:MAG: ComEA family DNA-binding protein [Candidatus Limivicinus sp.]